MSQVHEVKISNLYYVEREDVDEKKELVILATSPSEAAQVVVDHFEDVFEDDVTKEYHALCVFRCAASPVDPEDKTEVIITVWPLKALSKLGCKSASVVLG